MRRVERDRWTSVFLLTPGATGAGVGPLADRERESPPRVPDRIDAMPTSYRVVEVGEDAAEKLVSESGSYMDARRSYMDASFAKFRAGEVKGCVKLIEGAEKV